MQEILKGEDENRRRWEWDLCVVMVKYCFSCTVHRNKSKESVLGNITNGLMFSKNSSDT